MPHGVSVSPGPDGVVEVCPGGPLLVRGSASIRDADGNEVPRRRGTVAICRCGGTGIPPWCDGTHRMLARRDDRRDVREGGRGTAPPPGSRAD